MDETCVVGRTGSLIFMRDVTTGQTLYFTQAEFDCFVEGVKKGEFDSLLSPWWYDPVLAASPGPELPSTPRAERRPA